MDGVNVTANVTEGSVTHELNGRASATLKMPIEVASGDYYSEVYVDPGDGERFFGHVSHIDDQGDENTGYTVFTAIDPGEILEFRPARDADGDFSKPSFMTDFTAGPQMLEEILANSVTYEGDIGFSFGTFETGGVDLSGLPTDWPMTIAEIAGLLVQTGEVDVVMSYSSSGATLSAYNGRYGNDLSGSVQFKYQMGASSNCRRCRRTVDGTNVMNKYWLYGGPRVQTAADPAGDQHWKYNVTRDDAGVQALPGFSAVESLILASRAAFLERMEIRIIDRTSEAEGVASHDLDRVFWLRESLLRARPKTLVHLAPERGIAPSFGVGDRIHVEAGSGFRGGFSGTQRVYSYTYRWDVNGVVELGEPVGQAAVPAVVTSADQEELGS
jgi:hypothetical protein